MGTIKRIAKNSALMMGANVTRKFITLIITLLIARYFGAENFGLFSFAFSFSALFVIFTDFGAKVLLNREVARDKKHVNRYVANTLLLKVLLSFLMLIVVTLIAYGLDYPQATIQLVILAALVFIFTSLGEPIAAAFKAFEKHQYSAISIITVAVLRLASALAVIYLGLHVLEIIILYLIVEAFGFFQKLFFYHAYIHPFTIEWNGEFARSLLRRSIPFGVAGVLMTFYDKVDVTMISKMVVDPNIAIGWYTTAYSLVFAFEFIPMSIGAAVYPFLSTSYLRDKVKFIFAYKKLVLYYFFMTLPLSFGTLVVADEVVLTLFGNEYAPAILALQVLIWTLVFKFQMYSMGSVLNSMNREKFTMYATIVTLVVNVVLNLFLIPQYGIIGASVATIVSEATYFFICYALLRKDLAPVRLFLPFTKCLISCLIMFVVVWYLNSISVILAILVGIVVYVGLMVLLRAISPEDIDLVKRRVLRA